MAPLTKRHHTRGVAAASHRPSNGRPGHHATRTALTRTTGLRLWRPRAPRGRRGPPPERHGDAFPPRPPVPLLQGKVIAAVSAAAAGGLGGCCDATRPLPCLNHTLSGCHRLCACVSQLLAVMWLCATAHAVPPQPPPPFLLRQPPRWAYRPQVPLRVRLTPIHFFDRYPCPSLPKEPRTCTRSGASCSPLLRP